MRSTNRRRSRRRATNVGARRHLAPAAAAAAAAAALAFVGPASAQQLFFDQNGATSGLGSGAATWNAANVNWATTTAGTTDQAWSAGATANFNAGFTVNLADTESVAGLNFNSGATTLQIATGATNPLLDFGDNPFSLTAASTVGGSKSIIAVPIKGSKDMTVNLASNGQFELAGDMSQFTGNVYVNNTAATPASTTIDFAINNSFGSSANTIYMDQNSRLNANNPGTFNGVATPRDYTIASNAVLNYNAVDNATNYLSSSNGDNGTAKYGQANFVAGTQLVITYAGVITSPSSVNTNVVIGLGASGGRGTVVLSNHNTWNGNTTVVLASNNGLLQMGVDNALPTSTVLTFGTAGNTVAPMDLNGHSITLGGLATGTSANNNNGGGGADNGNIYNTSISGSAPAPATITIAGAANTTYAGDIGSTNLSVNPYNNNAPYVTGSAADGTARQVVQASRDISLVLNGPGSLTLAPVSNQQNGNEYTGTTTVNGGTLRFGRATPFAFGGTPNPAYTLTGGGNVVVNSGATLSSLPTTFGGANNNSVGGASGTIVLNSGASLTPGGAGSTGVLATSYINFNAGSSISFDLTNATTFDQIFTDGLTLDSSSPNHFINLSLTPGGTLVPGTYNLINGNIAGGAPNAGSFTLDTSSIPSTDMFKLIDTGSSLQLQILAPALRWDPTGSGANSTVYEGGGTWQAGSPFVNLLNSPQTEASWSNSAYATSDVIIGSDATQAGDVIHLGENVAVGGKLTFGPIFPGYNYNITGDGHTLTLNGGILVSNSAATSTTPSAEIDAPIVLGADQTWSVDPGQFFDVKGTVTGGHALTKTGSGILFIESAGGSVSSLAVNGGTVLLGAANSIGPTTPISLNGGGVEFSVNGTPANPVSIGANGGSLGATNQPGGGAPYNVTFTNSITGGNPLSAIGTGNLAFTGNLNVGTFTSSTSTSAGGGNVTLSGNNAFTAISITSGNLVAASAGALGDGSAPITLSGGNLTLSSNPSAITLNNPVNIGTNGSANMSITSAVPVTLAGILSGSGNVALNGPDYTLSGANTNGNSVVLNTEGMSLHVTNATGLGTATLAFNANATLDTPVDTSANTIRSSTANTSFTLTKKGTGTLTLTGAGSVNSVPGAGVVIHEGAIQMNNIASLGATNVTTVPGLAVTVDPGASLILNWATGGQTRYSGNITLNGGTLTRANNTVSGDYQLSIFGTNDATPLFDPAPTFTVAADSTISNLVTNQPDSLTVSRDILLEMPVVVNSGATLTAQTAGGTQDLTHATIVFRGVSNNTTYKYQNITLQPGATFKTTGDGEVDIGGTGRGIPVIANGAPGNDSKLLLSGHTFLRDSGSGNQGTGNTDMTRLVVNGSASAGLRVEAPMNAAYVKLADNTMDQNTVGLFGTNTVGAPNGNGFTILSPNRAGALSNPYTLADGTVINPQGTLTLAATDAAGATGVVNAGPSAPVPLTLALDNTPASGNLLYQLDGTGSAGARLLNFSAGVTLERSNPSAGSVAGQLKAATHLASLTLANSTSFDLVDKPLGLESSANINAYLTSHALFSSSVDADTNNITAIASLLGSDLGGATSFLGISGITDNTLILKPAYYGDINLDGHIDADDYAAMDRSVAKALPPKWIDGDFNNDGAVNSQDYFLMDKAFGITNGGTLSPALIAQRQAQFGDAYVQELLTSVPEPTSLSLLGLGSLALTARRRRRTR